MQNGHASSGSSNGPPTQQGKPSKQQQQRRSSKPTLTLTGTLLAAAAIAVLGVGAKHFFATHHDYEVVGGGGGRGGPNYSRSSSSSGGNEPFLTTASRLIFGGSPGQAEQGSVTDWLWHHPLGIPVKPSPSSPATAEPVQPLGAGPHIYTGVHHIDSRNLAYIAPGTPSRKFFEPFVPHAKEHRGVEEEAHFQVYERKRGEKLLGDEPRIMLLAKSPNTSYHFAHEAPIYLPSTDSVYWCSNAGAGGSGLHRNNVVYKLRDTLAATAERAAKGESSYEADVEEVLMDKPDEVQMTNGGTNYGGDALLLANQGRGPSLPGSLTVVTPSSSGTTHHVRTLLNNAHGSHLNAPNDIVIHPTSSQIFFTDPLYAQLQHFKDKPDLGSMVWAFDVMSGRLTPLDTDGVDMPNGLCFDPQGRRLYVTDTAAVFGGKYEMRADLAHRVVYVFDVLTEVDEGVVRHSLGNRRVFAHVDTGIADGIKTDAEGNVYAGTGDGIDVWSSKGTHLLKIYLPWGGAPNFVLAGNGRIVAISDVRIWLIDIAKEVRDPGLADRPAAGQRVSLP